MALRFFKRLRLGLMDQGRTMTQKTVRGLLWMGISNGCLALTETVQSLILVRLLTPLDFGISRVGVIAASYARVMTTTGIGQALVQSKEVDEELIDTSWVIEIARNLLQCVGLWAAAPWIAAYFEQPEVTLMLRVFALRYILSAFRNPAVPLLIRELNFRRHEAFERTYSLITFAVTVGAAVVLRNFWAFVIGQIVQAAADLIGSYVLYPYRPRLRFSTAKARQLIRYGQHIYISGVLGNVMMTLDGILLGRMLGVADLGIYSLVKNLATRVTQLLTNVTEPVLFPAMARIQHDLAQVRRAYRRIVSLLALVRAPVHVGMALVAPLVLPLIIPKEYLSGIPVFILFCLSGFLNILPINPLLKGIGKPHLTWTRSGATFLLFIPAILVLGPRYGMIGVAVACVIRTLAGAGIGLFTLWQFVQMGLGQVFRALLPSSVAAALMTAAVLPLVMWVARPTVLWSAAAVFLGAAVYVAWTWKFNSQAVGEVRGLIEGMMARKSGADGDGPSPSPEDV